MTAGVQNAEGEPRELKGEVRRSLPYSLGLAGLQIALSLLGMVLLVRYLEPAEYGVWALLGALSGPINLVVSFGYVAYLIRFVPALDDPAEVSRIVWGIVVRRMAMAAGLSVALVASFGLFASRFGLEGYGAHFAVYQVAICFNLGTLYLTYAFNARFMQKQLLLVSLPIQIATISLTVAGIWAKEPLLFFVWVVTGTGVVGFLLNAVFFARRYALPSPARLVAPIRQSSEERRYRRLSYIDEFGVSFLGADIGRYMIAYLSTNVQVAVYAVATTIVGRLEFFLPGVMFRALTEATFFSQYERSGDTADIDRMFRLVWNANTMVSLLFVAVFLPFGHQVLSVVFRSTYEAAYLVAVIFLVFLAMNSIPVGLVVKALKKPEVLIYSKVTVLLNIGLGIPLVSAYGAAGMAIATALSVALKNVIIFAFARRSMELHVPWGATAKYVLAAGAAAGLSHLAAPYVPLLLGLVLAVVLYALLVRLLSPLGAADKALLSTMLPSRVAWAVPLLLGR